MIKETGKIIAIEELHGKRVAVVECISKSACSGCNNQSSCGVGTVAKTFANKTHQFEVPYTEGMAVDEFIELQINNSDLIKSASLAYLVPLIFFIGGALLAKQFDSVSEIALIVIAVLCAVIGFGFTRLISHKLFSKKQITSLVGTQLKK